MRCYAKLAIILSLMAFLNACATPHLNRQYLSKTSIVQLNSNILMVSLEESRPTYRQDLEADLLYSCARATTNAGYDYFIVIGGDLYPRQLINSDTTLARYQHIGENQYTCEATASNIYLTAQHYLADNMIRDGQTKASAIIQMFKKPRPPRLWYAYDARGLINSLRPPG